MNHMSLRNNQLKFVTLEKNTNHFRGNSRDSIEGNAKCDTFVWIYNCIMEEATLCS